MDDLTLTPQKAMIGLTLLSAIPIVIFALWVDYIERTISLMKDEKQEIHLEDEIRNVRFSSLWILCIESVFFFASPVAKQHYPGLSLLVFFTALMALNQTLAAFEEKIRPKKTSRTQHFRAGLQSLFWIFSCTLLQFITAYGIVGASLWFGLRPGTPALLSGIIVICGTLGGALAGIVSNFLIAPLYLKKTFPNREPKDVPELLQFTEMAQTMLQKHNLKQVHIRVIQESKSIFGPAFVAGLGIGRKYLAPTLFFSEEICKLLNRSEFQAVIAHELAHLKHRHLEKRLFYSLGIFTLTLISTILLLTISVKFLPLSFLAPIRILCFTILLGAPVLRFFSTSKKQELEADELAITHFNSDPSSLKSALLKLQKDTDDNRKPGTTHPSLYERIQRIEVLHAQIKYGTIKSVPNSEKKVA